MCPLFLKLSSVLKLLILTTNIPVNIKTQNFYSCLSLTENFVVSIKSFHPLESFNTNYRESSLEVVSSNNFEIGFCRLKIQFVKLDFSKINYRWQDFVLRKNLGVL